MDNSTTQQAPGPKVALLALLAVVIAVAGLLALGWVLGIESLFVGFLFILYWTGIRHSAWEEFVPALLGAFGGLALAAALHFMPLEFGVAGIIVALVLVLISIYLLIRQRMPGFVNMSFMLLLTVATIPHLAAEADFIDMALALALGAAYAAGLMWLLGQVQKRKSEKASVTA